MKKIMEVISALLMLARKVNGQPTERVEIEKLQKGVSEMLKGASRRDIFHLFDEVVRAGFSSDSEAMEPDGKGGRVWNPEISQIYCDSMFRLLDILEKSQLAEAKDICKGIIWRAINYSGVTLFCRQLKVKQPLPNLLNFEGRNKAAEILRPMMSNLTEDILSLLNQAKELTKTSRHDEAKGARDRAEKLNQLYSRMDKTVLPWLEKQDPQKLTLGKTLDAKGNSSENTVVEIIRDALKESKS